MNATQISMWIVVLVVLGMCIVVTWTIARSLPSDRKGSALASRIRGSGWAWIEICGIALAVSMSLLTIILAAKVFTAIGVDVMGPTVSLVYATPGSASGPTVNDSFKDGIANTLTAVATAVAAITLILSIGTSWFATKLKETDVHLNEIKCKLDMLQRTTSKELDVLHVRSEEYLQAIARNLKMQESLHTAQLAVRSWLDTQSDSLDRWAIYATISLWLAQLMSPDGKVRKTVFGELCKYFPGCVPVELQPLDNYMIECHEAHGGTAKSVGVWCKVFSDTERQFFVESELGTGARPEFF